MTLPKIPVVSLDDPNHRRRSRETINDILSHKFDDSRVQTPEEVAAGITPVNPAYPPGHLHRYGAVGDNITDDSQAVQFAFSSGAQVTAIAGMTYYCGSATIDIPAGARASIYGVALRTAVNGTTFLDVVGDDVEILGGEIYGRGNSVATGDEALIRFSGSSAASYRTGLLVRDCYLHDSGFYGVFGEFSRDLVVSNCYIEAIGYAAVLGLSCVNWKINGNVIDDVSPGDSGNAYGVAFTRDGSATGTGTYPAPTDCEAIGNTISNIPLWEALDTHGGQRITFANNTIKNCLYGINVSPIPAVPVTPSSVVITGNVIDSGDESADPGRAIGSGGFDGSNKAQNIVVYGNVIRAFGLASNNEGAIMFQYTDGLVVANNVIEDSRASGICLLQDNDEFVISCNSIRGIRNGVANACGINIRNTTQTGHVADNYINATAEIGVFIAATNAGVSFGTNRIVTSGSQYTDVLNGGPGILVTGATTTDVASIANGAQATVSITVTGARFGDDVQVVCSISLGGLGLTAYVSANDTVTVVLQNNSGGAIDLASATYTAYVTTR
jgi:hypothetical protein